MYRKKTPRRADSFHKRLGGPGLLTFFSKQADRGFAAGAVFVVRLKGVEKGGEL